MLSIIYNKILKTQYLQRIYIAKFQINDCFDNITHEPIVFAQYFDNLSTIFINRLEKAVLLFHSFLKNIPKSAIFFI